MSGRLNYVIASLRAGRCTSVTNRLPHWQWSFSPGACQKCQAYVPQLVRCLACGTRWLCDECSENHECD